MISGEMFNELEVMARRIMGNPAPFGGVQLVLSGDYFQCARDLWQMLTLGTRLALCRDGHVHGSQHKGSYRFLYCQ